MSFLLSGCPLTKWLFFWPAKAVLCLLLNYQCPRDFSIVLMEGIYKSISRPCSFFFLAKHVKFYSWYKNNILVQKNTAFSLFFETTRAKWSKKYRFSFSLYEIKVHIENWTVFSSLKRFELFPSQWWFTQECDVSADRWLVECPLAPLMLSWTGDHCVGRRGLDRKKKLCSLPTQPEAYQGAYMKRI